MGSVTKTAGGAAAALLVQAGMVAAASVANAQPAAVVPCSTSRLVSAIRNANMVEGRVLRLAPRCDYVLTRPAVTGGSNGLPLITGDITLVGGPSTTISRSASARAFRLIEVASGGALSVRNIFLSGGYSTSTGGAILNSGTVELSHTTVRGNRAAVLGGGLGNTTGRMVIDTSLISGNTAATMNGGGIFNAASLSISFSRVTRNTAAVGEGGGLRNAVPGQARIFRSTFDHNVAGADGGGISNSSQLELIRTAIVRNSANDGGGVFNFLGGVLTQNGNVIRFNIPNNCIGCT